MTEIIYCDICREEVDMGEELLFFETFNFCRFCRNDLKIYISKQQKLRLKEGEK